VEQTTQESPQQDVQNSSAVFPYFTLAVGVLCTAATFGFWFLEDRQLWDYCKYCGYYDAFSIWGGAYWAYITSCFVHANIIHLFFNLYWLFILGKTMELEIGWRKTCLFFTGSAFVSSGFQFMISENTGIGLSGVLYAVAGYIWAARSTSVLFQQILTRNLFNQFIVWSILCIVLTQLGEWEVGNAAHVSGLVFGFAAAGAFALKRFRGVSLAGLAVGLILAVVPMFWFPTSLAWLYFKGYHAYEANQYDHAVSWYSKAIEKDSENASAYFNRSLAYKMLGNQQQADDDLAKAYQLDPSFKDDEESQEDSEAKD